ncbi:MAG: OadG family protein [Alistipes sp.]|nr:OadG family protein [Alistipes sp.]
MKRAILTTGLLVAGMAASAKGSDTILEKDPVGIYVTIVSVVTVLAALVVLFLMIQLFAKIMVKSAQKKAAQAKPRGVLVDDMKVSVPAGCDSVVNGEIIAAIALAVKLNKNEMHDRESDVITINKVARVYSPWSSKIHGLTPMPERIRK